VDTKPEALVAGMGQILVEPGNPAANLDRAIDCIFKSRRAGCGLIVLPECLDLGWTDPSAVTLAEAIPGPRFHRLAQAACDVGIHVVAGLTERDGDHIYNASVLIDSGGEFLLKHRKINELDIASPPYSTGKSLAVAETEFGTVGIPICADNFPDSLDLAKSLIRMGATLLLSPCAWAVPAEHDEANDPYGQLWLDAYVPLATEHRVSVIGVSSVGWIRGGPWKGRKCIGCSLAVASGGEVLARGPYGDAAEKLIIVRVPSH
jgi:predicted amidohydrolase